MLQYATLPTVNPATLAAARSLIAAVNPDNPSLGRALEKAEGRLLQREWLVNADGQLRIESWQQPGTYHHCTQDECDHPSRQTAVCWHRASWLLLSAIAAASLGPIVNADGTVGGFDPDDDLDWSILDSPPAPAAQMSHNPHTAISVPQAAVPSSGILWDANGGLYIPDRSQIVPAKAPEKPQDAPKAPTTQYDSGSRVAAGRTRSPRDPEQEAMTAYRAGQKLLMTDAELERRARYKPSPAEIEAAAAELFGDDPPGATYTPPPGLN